MPPIPAEPSGPVTLDLLAQELRHFSATVTAGVTELKDVVKEHHVTLYGEKNVTGMIGRIEKLEGKVNMVIAGGSLVGSVFGIWLIERLLALLTQTP